MNAFRALRLLGGQCLLRVDQHRQVEAVVPARLGGAPHLARVAVQGAGEQVLLVEGQVAQAHRPQARQPPEVVAAHQPGLQQGAGQALEELAGQALQAWLPALAEQHPQGQGIAHQGAVPGQLAEQRGQGVELQVDQRLARQLVERFHRGQHPLAPGLGQQRDIVAAAQVVELAAQVEHMGGAVLLLLGDAVATVLGQEVGGADQVLGGVVGLPVIEAVDDDSQGAHGGIRSGGKGERLRSYSMGQDAAADNRR